MMEEDVMPKRIRRLGRCRLPRNTADPTALILLFHDVTERRKYRLLRVVRQHLARKVGWEKARRSPLVRDLAAKL